MNAFDVFALLVSAFVLGVICFGGGYLVAAREFGKDVHRLNDKLSKQGEAYREVLEENSRMARVMKGDKE